MFDASAARAMARKSVDLLDFMVTFKSAIVAAAERGELLAVAALPETVPLPPGVSQDAPDFLLSLFRGRGHPIWVDAVRQAQRAGYALRPVWSPVAGRPGVAALEFDWSRNDEPAAGAEPLLLLPATAAYAQSQEARAPAVWVERVLVDVRRAAEAGKLSCALRDPLDAEAPGWARRRELLHGGGFRLELRRTETGTVATIGW